jgi:4-amino-4-deoxy-L-arabinose transferase-like glycosyltransferase
MLRGAIHRFPRTWILPAVIFTVALVIRVYCASVCTVKPDFSDMAEYNALAVYGALDTYRAPLYPLFLRLVYSVFGDFNYVAVFVIQGVIGAVTSILMYAAVARVCNRKAGLIAAAIFAVYPHFIMYNITTLTETLGILCVVTMMFIASTDIPDARKVTALAVATGLGALLKPAFLFFVPGFLATVRRRRVFILLLVSVIAPWTIRNAVVHRRFVPISETGAFNFYLSYNEKASGTVVKAPELERIAVSHEPADPVRTIQPSRPQAEYIERALYFIIHNKLRTAQIIYNKVSVLFMKGWPNHLMGVWRIEERRNLFYVMEYAYIPVMILGFVGLARYYRRGHGAIAAPVLVYVSLVILLSIFKFRFRLLMEPLLIMYTAILLSGGDATGQGSSFS